ncbi:MAG: UDP-N-acetylglucosamine 2-epimerase (non-hydrolyzing) [Planctomycetes bacterium]|nr:UDP-N-acetylglucosamine 2-epimerase (non-hydrolyzing) [Planctomycetota bacterium]
MIRIINVVGARPNFMKMAPILAEMDAPGCFDPILVHTGQHYDDNMSGDFFRDLGLREPDVNLDVGSASHAVQTAEVMRRIEPVILERKPDVVLVVGDVNSTLAAALVSAKLHVPVAHVESGLRSFDRAMPEEINRIVTDVLSDYLFANDGDAAENLGREGIAPEKVHVVGDVMVDTLLMNLDRARTSGIRDRLGLVGDYAVLTLHRPSNVDDPAALREVLGALADLKEDLTIVFAIHPRTRKRIAEFGLQDVLEASGALTVDPLGYLDFLALQANARVILTDSGGIQEEAFTMGAPCVTLRDTTERMYTIEQGGNVLVGHNRARIVVEVRRVLKKGAERIAEPRRDRAGAAKKIVEILARHPTP